MSLKNIQTTSESVGIERIRYLNTTHIQQVETSLPEKHAVFAWRRKIYPPW